MRVDRKGKITILGFLLFILSAIVVPLNETTAIFLLLTSLGTIIFAGLVDGLRKHPTPILHRKKTQNKGSVCGEN